MMDLFYAQIMVTPVIKYLQAWLSQRTVVVKGMYVLIDTHKCRVTVYFSDYLDLLS